MEGVQMATDVAWQPFDLRVPEIRDDPYPVYARLREEDPVHRGAFGEWIVTRYEDVSMVLNDPRFSNDVRITEFHRQRLAAMGERAAEYDTTFSMIGMDPPDHTRLRRLVQTGFSPRQIDALRPRIESLVDELLDPLESDGAMDLMEGFALPLPVTVICELLGVPVTDQPLFHDLVQRMLDDHGEMEEIMERSFEARVGLEEYIGGLLEERRAHPRDDLMSALVRVEQEGDQLSEREVVETAMLLFIAGHVTTVNLVGNGVLALLRHPEELRRMRDDPGIVKGGVEELLRYDGPVHGVSRAALEDVELHGTVIRRADLVTAALPAANRDPARFPDPDTLDLARTDRHHVAFGRGIHFCLGAPLARLEGQIAIPALLRRFPDLALAEGHRLQWTGSFLRGLEALPVTA
jgi:cytochrome P450